jgi:hypothetical protein
MDMERVSTILGLDWNRAFNPHSPDNALSFGAACAIQI